MSNVLHAVVFGYIFVIGQLAVAVGEFTTLCYNISNYQHCWSTDGTAISWQGAWDACRDRNSTLLSVTSNQVQSMLGDFRLSMHRHYGNNGMWTNVATGVIDKFHWIEGTSETLGEVNGQFSDTRRFAAIVITPDDNRTVVYRAYEYTDASHYICQFPQGGFVSDVQYTNWDSGSPLGPDGFTRCVLLTNILQWSDSYSCTELQRFACQTITPISTSTTTLSSSSSTTKTTTKMTTTTTTTTTRLATTTIATHSSSSSSSSIRMMPSLVSNSSLSTPTPGPLTNDSTTELSSTTSAKSSNEVSRKSTVPVGLAVGVGVGVGAPLIIAVVIIIAVLLCRCHARKRDRDINATPKDKKLKEETVAEANNDTPMLPVGWNEVELAPTDAPEPIIYAQIGQATDSHQTTCDDQTYRSDGHTNLPDVVYAELQKPL